MQSFVGGDHHFERKELHEVHTGPNPISNSVPKQRLKTKLRTILLQLNFLALCTIFFTKRKIEKRFLLIGIIDGLLLSNLSTKPSFFININKNFIVISNLFFSPLFFFFYFINSYKEKKCQTITKSLIILSLS